MGIKAPATIMPAMETMTTQKTKALNQRNPSARTAVISPTRNAQHHLMFATRRRKLGIILAMLLVAFAVLFATAQINKPHWQWIAQVEPLADGRTLRAELLFSRPRFDGTFCERVVDTVVEEESAARVAVGVQVYNECAPFMSWGRARSSAAGHPYTVDVRLRAPLGGRLILERGSERPIPIRGESPRY